MISLRHGGLLLWGLLAILSTTLMEAAQRQVIHLDYVRERALRLAQKDYRAPETDLPRDLRGLNYDQYRDIRFRPQEALWKKDGLPWALEMFHRGYLFPEKVVLHENTDTHVQDIPFVADWFTYGPLTGLPEDAWFPSHLGYSGIRLKYPINDPAIFDEVAVFQGASYFRMLGPGQLYGASARGVAINTLNNEEFPHFTEFWLQRPENESDHVRLFALLDGPSITGAFQFNLYIEDNRLRCEVRSTLYPRTEIERVGLAPFSSMFYFGESSSRPPSDFRPEVHDSDGLLVESTDGTFTWRPLSNEGRTRESAHSEGPIAGFGLLQRDRAFTSYEDLESSFERRPSVWVTPLDPWPAGRVRLIEILSAHEMMDNIVAFWELETVPPSGEPIHFNYQLSWQMDDPSSAPRVLSTRTGRSVNTPGETTLAVDFEAPPPELLPPEATPSYTLETPSSLEIIHESLARNPQTGGWRLALQVRPKAGATESAEATPLKAQLMHDGTPVSERWVYPWIPAQP